MSDQDNATAPAADVAPEVTSIDDSMSAAYDAIMERDEAPAAETNTPEPAPEEVEAVEAEDTEITDQPEDEVSDPVVATPSVEAPNSWSAEHKERWAGLPPETQAYIAKRESEAHDQISRMGQELSAWRPVGETMQTHEQTFSRHGITPIQGVQELLKVQDRLDSDPVGTLREIAGMYNVDLSSLATNGAADQGEPSPQVANLQKQVQELTSRLSGHERQNEEQKQVEFQNSVNKAKEELVSSGIEQKPHYEALKPAIAELIRSGLAKDFAEAYDKAAWADPEARKTLLEEQKKAQLEEKAQAVAKARKSARVNVGSKPSKTVTAPKTWEETVDATANAIMG